MEKERFFIKLAKFLFPFLFEDEAVMNDYADVKQKLGKEDFSPFIFINNADFFKQKVKNDDFLITVAMSNECALCIMQHNILKDIFDKFIDIPFVLADYKLISDIRIKILPTFVIYEKGELLDVYEGFQLAYYLQEFFKEVKEHLKEAKLGRYRNYLSKNAFRKSYNVNCEKRMFPKDVYKIFSYDFTVIEIDNKSVKRIEACEKTNVEEQAPSIINEI